MNWRPVPSPHYLVCKRSLRPGYTVSMSNDSLRPAKPRQPPPVMSGQRSADNLTPKQARFAQAYVRLGDASAAYRAAYECEGSSGDTINKRAWELVHKHEGVAGRIRVLQEEMRREMAVSVESLTRDLQEDRELARELGQPSAAVSANKVIGRMHGLIDTKQDSAATVLGELAKLVSALDSRPRLTETPGPAVIEGELED